MRLEGERARMAAAGRRGRSDRPDYRSRHPFGIGSTIRRSDDGRLCFRRSTSHPEDCRHARVSLGTDVEPDLMTDGDSPCAHVLREVLVNPHDPLHRRACQLRDLVRSLHQMSDVEETRATTAANLTSSSTLRADSGRVPTHRTSIDWPPVCRSASTAPRTPPRHGI